jgi:RNA polymerase sigma-54 factor
MTDDTELSLEKPAYFSPDDYFEERSSDGRDLGYFTSGNVTHPSYEYFLSTATDLFDHLIWQLRLSKESEEIREVGELIIGNIDENGYLRLSIDEIMELSKSYMETAQKALTLVQSFDPPGIAART